MLSTREFLAERGRVCAYCGGVAIHREHVVPVAIRKRHHIEQNDERYHVPSCGTCNYRKNTRKYYPPGFDVSILPGKGWQEWRGGKALEVLN